MDGAERHLKEELGFGRDKHGDWVRYQGGDDIRHESMESAKVAELMVNAPRYATDTTDGEHEPALSRLNRDGRIAYGLSVLHDMYHEDEIDILALRKPQSGVASTEPRVLDDGVVTCIMYVPRVSRWDGCEATGSTTHAIVIDSTRYAVSFCNDVLDESGSFHGHRNDVQTRVPELTADIACTVARMHAEGDVTDAKCVGSLGDALVIDVTYDDGEHECHAVRKGTFECWVVGDMPRPVKSTSL